MPVGYGSPIGHGSGYGYDFRGEIGRVYRHYYRQMFWTKLRQSNYLRTGSDQIRHDGVGLTRDNSRFAQHICSYSGRHCLEEDLVSTGHGSRPTPLCVGSKSLDKSGAPGYVE
ncbi:hypothetical protein V6N13_107282 [Hibiscus sabdariffa]